MEQVRKVPEGILSAIAAYVFWGILPMYWKLIAEIPAHEILAHRIFWSFIFMACLLTVMKKNQAFYVECRQVAAQPRKLFGVVAGAVLISVNWFIYIWAVNDNRIIETSLGYYINPLFNVLIGMILLHERLSFWQLIAVVLAAIGVLNLALNFGSIPWVAIVLAVSFSCYGLCKKIAGLSAMTSITIETLLIAPFSFIYLLFLHTTGKGLPFTLSPQSVLLIGTGVVTAIPLLLFSNSANKLSLTVLGLIQYVSPTIGLLLGIFLFHETFTYVHLVSFGFIWLALLVFSLSKTPLFAQLEMLIIKKRCME